jgi:hypothetical protein
MIMIMTLGLAMHQGNFHQQVALSRLLVYTYNPLSLSNEKVIEPI